MSKLDEIKQFILEYNELEHYQSFDNARITFDILTDDTTNYAIIQLPINPVVEQFIDGSRIMQNSFNFQALQPITENIKDLEKNTNFFTELTKWIEERNFNEDYPSDWLNIEVYEQGYLFDLQETQDKATYSMGITVQYMEERKVS